MTKQTTFTRRHIKLFEGPKGTLRAVMRGNRAWVVAPGRVIPVPAWLLYAPRGLTWLLREHLHLTPSRLLPVTVIPQMDCNAACGYCIQNVSATSTEVVRIKGGWMRDSVMDDTVSFIERRRIQHGREGVSLTIFGGEPLLNPGRCYRLLESIQHLKYASIVTNGVLLTPQVAERLTKLGVRHIQITFDGARQDHDRIRVLAANGGGTYDTIVSNLAKLDSLPVLPSRQLRVNVTRSNLAGLDALVRDLADRLDPDQWMVYFALVDNNAIGWDDALQSGQTVGAALAELARLAARLGFQSPLPSAGTPDCATCGEQFGAGSVINADGKLSSCWDTAGFPEWTLGDVVNGYLPERDTAKWVQCGHRSLNQGPLDQREGSMEELDWALLEIEAERQMTSA